MLEGSAAGYLGSVEYPGMVDLPQEWNFGTPTTLPSPAIYTTVTPL